MVSRSRRARVVLLFGDRSLASDQFRRGERSSTLHYNNRVTLVAAVVVCVLFALSPAHDPLNLSEHQRTRYVYAAEVLLVLLFLHIRLTMPWLFTGFIERYWPLVVMVVAYFGVVASEALRRRKLFVLAHPLERTGAFLPLLPVVGFWIASSEVDFSLVLFVIGGLYGLLSVLRRSFAFGLLAAVAGNAGLWYAFNRTADYGFVQHPQLWLIPIAVSVLIAAYLNEDKMTEDQMTGIRYLSLVTIYVSSTADIFINGAANSPWLPLILGTLSLAGIFAGIVFASAACCCWDRFSLVVDHHDDLVRNSEFWLDVAMVHCRNRDWRDDHLHVCVVREKTKRGVACGRRVEEMGPLVF